MTGATGGLGLSLVDALARAGREVVATGRREGSDPRLCMHGVRYVRADLAEGPAPRELCENVATVFHCAALSSPWGPAAAFRRANVDATTNLLAEAARHGVTAFVHVSSPSIYAAMRDRVGITEADPPADPPLNDYARTKLAAERMVLNADGDLRTVVIRPRAIVGPDDNAVLPRLVALARGGTMPLPNRGRALVEFTDVRDVVSALLLAEARIDAARGRAINVSGGRPVSVRDVSARLGGALGLHVRQLPVPMALARPLARLVELFSSTKAGVREPRLTRYALATLAFSQTFDLSSARCVLGWSPRHDGLATLLDQAALLDQAGARR